MYCVQRNNTPWTENNWFFCVSPRDTACNSGTGFNGRVSRGHDLQNQRVLSLGRVNRYYIGLGISQYGRSFKILCFIIEIYDACYDEKSWSITKILCLEWI